MKATSKMKMTSKRRLCLFCLHSVILGDTLTTAAARPFLVVYEHSSDSIILSIILSIFLSIILSIILSHYFIIISETIRSGWQVPINTDKR